MVAPKPGFEPETDQAYCKHPQHKPAHGLRVPPGQRYRHVCPNCGREELVRASHAFRPTKE